MNAGWSPDGSTIIFSNNGSLYRVNPDGSGLRKIPLHGVLTTSFAFDRGWSPNGQKIVFGMFTGGTAGVTKTGPSASSPTARSIARAVREAECRTDGRSVGPARGDGPCRRGR